MLAISLSLLQLVLLSSLPSLTILGFDDNCTKCGVEYARILAPNVTKSLLKINLYAVRGPCNQTGCFYTNCQCSVTTQTHVSFYFIPLYLTTHYMYKEFSKLEQRSWCTKQSLAKTDSKVLSTLDDITIVKD